MSETDFELAVIIVNYKTPDLVIDCLDTLVPELAGKSAKVVIVDNRSEDGSLERIQGWVEGKGLDDLVTTVPSPRNGGFSWGNNLGIRQVAARYYLLLNSDTLVRKHAIDELLSAISDDDAVGLVSPRLEWPDGEPQVSCFRYITPLSALLESADTGFITKLFPSHDVAVPVQNARSYPDWTSFACVLIRKAVFDDIGLLDENFFMYFDDVEFCQRARKHGWKVMNHPPARIVHLRGKSGEVKKNTSERKRLPKYFYASRAHYYKKVYGRTGLFLANAFWLLGRTISLLRESMLGKEKTVCEKQWLDIWTDFGR